MKKWNKATAAALLTAFVMTGALPAHAEGTETSPVAATEQQEQQVPADMIQKDQAIAKVRDLFGGLAELPFADAFYNEDADYVSDGPIWHVSFYTYDNTNPEAVQEELGMRPFDSMNAMIDAKTGELLQFDRQDPEYTGDKVPSAETALRAADAFLHKVAPDLVAKLTPGFANSGRSGGGFTSESGKKYAWTSTSVSYSELVNGIPFESNSLRVNVDQYGRVVSYHKSFRFDSSKLPKPEGIISKDVAKVGLSQAIGMNLSYQTQTLHENANGDIEMRDEPVLTYMPNDLPEIDAFTGKPRESAYQTQQMERTMHKITGENQVPVAKDKEAATKLVSDLMQVDLSKLEMEEVQRDRIYTADADGEAVTYNWHEPFDNPPADPQNWQPLHVTASFNGKTGELMFVNRSGPLSKETSFTVEEGVAKALDIVKKYAPSGEQELMMTGAYDNRTILILPSWYDASKGNYSPMSEDARYGYSFVQTHQGVMVADRGYSLDLDAKTGQLLSLSLPFTKPVQLPDSGKAADPEVVEATFLANHPLKLAYVWEDYFGQQAPEGYLVYRFDYSDYKMSYINALTGFEVDR